MSRTFLIASCFAAALVFAGCSSSSTTDEDAGADNEDSGTTKADSGTGTGDSSTSQDSSTTTDSATTTDSSTTGDAGKKAFGEPCDDKSECASDACFVGGNQKFCSFRCTVATAATDCPKPPTDGNCNNQGYCRKP